MMVKTESLVVPYNSLALVGPRLEPEELAASYPAPAALGRGWKYLSIANGWPSSLEPITLPASSLMSEPLALSEKIAWPIPQTIRGYAPQRMTMSVTVAAMLA